SLQGCCPGGPAKAASARAESTKRPLATSARRRGASAASSSSASSSNYRASSSFWSASTRPLRVSDSWGFVLIPLGIVVFSGGVLWAAMESWRYRAALMAIHALDPLAASGVFLNGTSVSSVSVNVAHRSGAVHSAPPVDPDGPMARPGTRAVQQVPRRVAGVRGADPDVLTTDKARSVPWRCRRTRCADLEVPVLRPRVVF
ncbi:hypothetical protein MTO96_021124, partial [Rhipicephalus appendiculatus]